MSVPTTELFLSGTFLVGIVTASLSSAPEPIEAKLNVISRSQDGAFQDGTAVRAAEFQLNRAEQSTLTAIAANEAPRLEIAPSTEAPRMDRSQSPIYGRDDSHVTRAMFLEPVDNVAELPDTEAAAEVLEVSVGCSNFTRSNCQPTRVRIRRRR